MGFVKLVFSLIFVLSFFSGSISAVGGWSAADADDEGVQRALRVAMNEHEKQSNSLFSAQVIRIVTAHTQIVAGVNYRITVDIGYTSCRKNENRDPSLCTLQQTQTCTFTVWERAWENSIQLTDTDCGPIMSYESPSESESSLPLLGGDRKTDVMSTDVKEAAAFALTQLQEMADGLYRIQDGHLIDASKQTVAGSKYKMKIEFEVKSCDAPELLEDCKTGSRSENVVCEVEVLEQSWKNPRHVLKSYRCNRIFDPQEAEEITQASLNAFEDFKQRHGKKYDNAEEERRRFSVFQENMNVIKFLQDHERGTAVYGATEFADLTTDEFRKLYLTSYWDQSYDPRLAQAEIPDVTIPKEYDWRHYNAVTTVKNQGSCGSCWAFSVTGNIEGQWALQKKNLVSLSEQELVDCDKLDLGCNGGLPSNAYQEIQRLGGLETETDYPYEGRDDTCHLQKEDIKVYINGSLNISKDETEMASWLYKNGPLSIGINAFAMQFYFGGVSHPWKLFCSPDALDHGVLIVGYGVQKGWFSNKPYWIVKNSWGSSWGESGYYLVYRGDGTCGLNQMVSSAVVK